MMLKASSALRQETEPSTPVAEVRRAVSDGGERPEPLHVAIIMDGNGRWAKARGLPRLEGHRRGVKAVQSIVESCADLGVGRLTLFAFSTENWRRPSEEVQGLMSLFRHYLRRESAQLVERGARVRFIGDRSVLASDLIDSMTRLERESAGGSKLSLDVALNYGARSEIAAAARALAGKVARGEISADAIDEGALEAELFTRGAADPDLVIRTSGEQRLSNFLLWQAAYSEFYFTEEHWPDFDRASLERALESFRGRNRRFGAVAG